MKLAKKWFVFDKYDCFGSFARACDAGKFAEELAADGFHGVEIRHFTAEEFEAYCQGGETALEALRKKG